MNNMVTIYGTLNILSQKVLNLYSEKFNRTHNNKMTIRDFCFKYDFFKNSFPKDSEGNQYKDDFLSKVDKLIHGSEISINQKIDLIQKEFELKETPYPPYDIKMFNHALKEKKTLFAEDIYTFDIIWSWSALFRFFTIINKCQYLTILCELARKNKVISRNKLGSTYRMFYISPIQIVLYETEFWLSANPEEPGYRILLNLEDDLRHSKNEIK